MSMWLQTRNVRHLVPRAQPVRALCGATPRMWFNDPPGAGQYVTDAPRSTAPADMNRPICKRCQDTLAQLNQDNR